MTIVMEPAGYLAQVGALVRGARQNRGLTQAQLAEVLGTSQSAINRIEQGAQNVSLDMLSRISAALDSEIISIGQAKHSHLRVTGGRQLSGRIEVKSSKNGAVALLCASLLNRGRTTLRGVARIVEVDRIVDVLRSIGVAAVWSSDGRDLEIHVPADLDLESIDVDAAKRTRSVIMFLGPLLGMRSEFHLPY
ncbi:MAG: helix-turn-helix domain-containing protein, partial [Cellulomonas sp.]